MNDKCNWCDSEELTGICHITNQQYCAKHRNHTHDHLEIEKYLVRRTPTRTPISPLRKEET